MPAAFTRRLSPVERIWLAADQLMPPFVNQLVLEGDGELDEAAWRSAVAAAAAVTPGSRLVLRGHWWWSRWVATASAPPVRVVDGTAWDGRTPDGATFLAEPLPARRGPTVEILLVRGAHPRVVVRSHHSVMDGRGHLLFVSDLFRALRGEPPIGATATITDADIARQLRADRPQPRKPECLAPTGASSDDELGVTWRRITLEGRYSRLLPRLCVAVARAARSHSDGNVRLDVPADMRTRSPQTPRSTANLTGMLHVDVCSQDTPEQVQARIGDLLEQRAEARFVREMGPARFLPMWLLRVIGRSEITKSHRTNRWVSSGALSNLGRIDHSEFCGAGFRASSSFFIPPGNDGTALFIALTGTSTGVELCATAPRRLAANARLDRLLTAITAELER